MASPVRRRVVAAVAAGALLGLALLVFLDRSVARGRAQAEAESQLTVRAAGLADLVATVEAEAGDLPTVVGAWAETFGAEDVRVVSGRRLAASTASADSGEEAAPRRLRRDEKELYDTSRRLATAASSNRADDSAREQEIEIRRDDDGAFTVAAPYPRRGEAEGAVFFRLAPPAPATGGSPWLLLLVLPAAALAWPLAARGRTPALILGGVLVALATIAAGLLLRSEIAERETRAGDRLVALMAEQRVDLEGLAEDQGLADRWISPATWDVDERGRPRGRLNAAGEIDAAARDARISDGRRGLGRLTTLALGLAFGAFLLIASGALRRFGTALKENRQAYFYTVPAMVGMLLLVFFPFTYGLILSFTNQNIYNFDQPLGEIWVGLQNYVDILTDFDIASRSEDGLTWNYENFYWTLLFTIVWTIANVTIGVSVGLLLALVLNTPGLALRPIYRVLLILPWALPNYITSLIWKGMFHQQFGVINQVLQMFGISPVAWFDSPLSSFATVLATNGWLSFPFMMVVCLGALQSIPRELYEAAWVDGASRWQQFRSVTLPGLKPALIPAIVISVVWTFNQFNVIYLVSEGEPAGATEILVTESYKLAFEQYRYGYAAAYSAIIFLILLVYGTWQVRVTKATEGL